MAQSNSEGACDDSSIGTWQASGANAWNGGAILDSVKVPTAAGIIVDSKDTESWPSIGDKGELCMSSAQSSTSGFMPAVTIAANSGGANAAPSPQMAADGNQPDRKENAYENQGSNGDQRWSDNSSSWESNQHGNTSQSQPSSEHLDNSTTASSGLSGWGGPFTSLSGSTDAGSKWGAPTTSATWGSQSPVKQAAGEWDATASNAQSQWGASNESWGQTSRLPNTGTERWGQPSQLQTSQASQQNVSLPSKSNAPSAWGKPPTTPTAAWQTPNTQNQTMLTENTTSSNAWSNTSTSSTTTLPSTSGVISPTNPSELKTTSWAGAAAKGLPKTPTKPPEPVDPVQMQIQQSINSADGWGRMPVRQDTAWGEPPEKKKQDDGNTWNATPNNGTAIWEASKSSNGNSTNWEDKSTWNQKVISNDDPNVWNGPGSKGKDNALWDNVPATKEQEPIDQSNTWNASSVNQAPANNRTISQSSGDANTESGWSGNVRSSPPNSNPPSQSESGWGMSSGNIKPQGWGTDPTNRNTPVSDSAGTSYWGDPNMQSKPSGNWNQAAQNGTWSDNQNSPVTTAETSGWNQSQSVSTNSGNWTDAGGSSNWGSKSGKSTFGWEEGGGGNNSGNEFSGRRQFKSESDATQWSDTDMGDWNESNSVWSSAGGFKRNVQKNTIPEHPMNPPVNNKNHYNPQLTRGQMLTTLVNMGFPREDALRSLINNDMNLQNAISDLFSNSSMQQGHSGHHQQVASIPGAVPGAAEKSFPHPPSQNPNTPYSNAQVAKSFQGSSRLNKHNPQQAAIGRSNSMSMQQQQQRMIVQQLQLGVRMGNIHPQILNLPLTDVTLRSIQQLLSLQQTYQHHQEQYMKMRHTPNMGNHQMENSQMMYIKQQMMNIQQQLIKQQQTSKMMDNNMMSDQLSNLSIVNPTTSSSQSRLSQWKLPNASDKAPGSRQNNMLHSSHSTPNLQSGMIPDNSPWSASSSTAQSGWSMSPGSEFSSEGHQESQSSNGPINPSSTLDFHEFVPGKPWRGAEGPKVEDDPTITPGSVSKSLSISTATINTPGLGSELGWAGGLYNRQNTWSNASPSSPSNDMWNKNTRPPPGFNKSMNRSLSMPHAPSDKSAFSPVGSSWDGPSVNSTWLVLRNLTPQIDGATLKTLCMQHGPLLNFFVNQSTGQALVQYSSKQEGLKAQKSLNSCVLGNTTIMAEFADENEVQRIIDQKQGSTTRSNSLSTATSVPWSNSNSLWSGNSSSSGSTWGNGNGLLDGNMSSTLLPVDFLGSGNDGIM